MTTYKLQFACLVIIIYVLTTYYKEKSKEKGYNIYLDKHTRIFEKTIWLIFFYTFFDIATVYTVNHLDTVPDIVNRGLHLIFLVMSEILLFEMHNYLITISEYEINKFSHKVLIRVPLFVSIIVAILFIGQLKFIEGKTTNYSMGITVIACFAVGMVYLLLGILVCWKRKNFIENKKASVLKICFFEVTGILVMQVIFPEFLVSSLAFTLMVLTFYVHIENQAARRLQSVYEEVIHSFADVVESRDGSTGEHIKRTTIYVKVIAEGLRKQGLFTDVLTKDYINCLVQVAPMHDIGKISVPDAILQKPGRLTKEEYEEIKKHTTVGAALIQQSFNIEHNSLYSEMAYEVALYHHEKWNGNGYPKKLSGEEIPLCARIMAVADVFDAVSQKRCYRDAMSMDESFKIIEDGIGKDFDPVIAQCFIELRALIEEECRRWVDA